MGLPAAAVAVEEEFLTEVAGIAEACPGIAVVVRAFLAVAVGVEALLAAAVV